MIPVKRKVQKIRYFSTIFWFFLANFAEPISSVRCICKVPLRLRTTIKELDLGFCNSL